MQLATVLSMMHKPESVKARPWSHARQNDYPVVAFSRHDAHPLLQLST